MNAQPDLFDSRADRERVRGRIGHLIRDFYLSRKNRPIFHMETLEDYIRDHGVAVAPGSPCRILRMLRQGGSIDYSVSDRSRSQYTFHYRESV